MVHVGRSLGVVVVGWISGFMIAIAWGATRVNNPRLASALSGWAIAGMVITGLLLVSIAVSDRAERRRAERATQRWERETDTAAAAAKALEERSAARIAELEARLAREQEVLDAAVASLATAELAATGHVSAGLVEPVPDPAAAELEPVLRQEVVDAVAELVGRVEPGTTALLAGELEALVEKSR
jgi:C4-dicarboxylate-specific signal transduction histidine kinase